MKKTSRWFFSLALLAAILLMATRVMADSGDTPPTTQPAPNTLLAQEATNAKGQWARVWRAESILRDALAVDTSTLFGVGTDGMILKTTDGGTYWHYQAPVDGVDLHAIDGVLSNLWAVGSQGTILHSLDNGETWESLSSDTQQDLMDISAVGGGMAWAVGNQGTILHTADNGQTWTTQPSGVDADLTTILIFGDGQHGVAAGADGTLLTTSDRGTTWTLQTGVLPATTTINDGYVDGGKAWLAGNDGRIFFTDDMGASWQEIANVRYAINRIRMYPDAPLSGWIVGMNGKIGRTSDGGHSWRNNKGDEGYHLYALALAGDDHIWTGGQVMVPDQGNWDETGTRGSWFVWASQDGGTRWKAQISGLYPKFFNIYAASEQIIYAVGQDLQILKSEDGGYSWREIHQEFLSNPSIIAPDGDPHGFILHSISCAPDDPNDCHAVGRFQTMIHTLDGGETWSRETIPGVGRPLYDVVMTTAQSGIAVSRSYNFYTDDGFTWHGSFDNGVNVTNLDLDMINSWQGAASTKKSYFRYTIDAGRHWKGYFFPTFGIFYNSGVDAYDINQDGQLDYVWLAGCTAYHDVDGPCKEGAVIFNPDAVNDREGWRALLLDPNVPRLQKIEMVDEQTGWVVGFDGAVLFTEDGGNTWQIQPSMTDANLYGLDVYNRGLAFAAGLKGDIIRYSEPDRRLAAGPQWHNTVDGDLSEWTAQNGRHINSEDIDTIVGETPDPDDLDAWMRVRWDDRGLYLGIEVTDTSLTTQGDAIDQIRVALDGLWDGQMGDDDYILTFRADGSAQGIPTGGQAAITAQDQGYTIEAFLPEASLGGDFVHLRKIGVNIAIDDAAPGDTSYRTQLIWAGTTLADDPASFGYITLYQFDRNQPTQTAVVQGHITIDGDLTDWTDTEHYALTRATADSIQGDLPTDDADLSAQIQMGWWKTYFFMGVDVVDATPSADDSLLLAFDVGADHHPTSQDIQLRVWPDGRVLENGQPSSHVLAAGQPTDTGYRIELAIPASILGGDFEATKPAMKLHMNYGLLDVDGTSRTWMNWQGASIAGIQADFGWVELTPVIQLIKADFADPRFQDTFIYEWNPDDNYDNLSVMRIRNDGIESPMIRLDIPSLIPEGIDLALFHLGIYTVQDRDAPMTARIYRLLRPWKTSETTWNRPQKGETWETPGAKGPNDQAQTPTDEQPVSRSSSDGGCYGRNGTWFDVTEDIKAFQRGDKENYGWILRGDSTAQINYFMASTRYTNPDCLPEVYFEYTYPPGILPTPTPSAIHLYLPIITR